MEPTKEKNSIKNDVLRKISSKEVSMHSKAYFVARTVAAIVLGVAVLLISAFIFSFIFFHIRIGGQGHLFGFGPRGFWLFLKLFPWGMLLIDLALIILLEQLVHRFRFGYAIPTLYLLIALLACAALVGFIVDRTPLNDFLLERADVRGLPQPLNGFYEGFRPSNHEVCDCVITAVNGTMISAYTRNNPSVSVTIAVPPGDPQLSGLTPGDTVIAGGSFQDGVLHAFGIRRVN